MDVKHQPIPTQYLTSTEVVNIWWDILDAYKIRINKCSWSNKISIYWFVHYTTWDHWGSWFFLQFSQYLCSNYYWPAHHQFIWYFFSGIKRLQCILLKTVLCFGVQVYGGVEFKDIVEPESEEDMWRISVKPENHPVGTEGIDVLIGAEGKHVTIPGFRWEKLFSINT